MIDGILNAVGLQPGQPGCYHQTARLSKNCRNCQRIRAEHKARMDAFAKSDDAEIFVWLGVLVWIGVPVGLVLWLVWWLVSLML